MKMTLLEMTQSILSDMEDDEVNSISDTSSALSVAGVCVKCYYELVTELSLPGSNRFVKLEALSDVDHPNYLKLPDGYAKMWWFKYNDREVKYLNPWDFVKFVTNRDVGITVEDFGGANLKIDNTSHPLYWTSFDDVHIVLDSWNTEEDSTLQASKTSAYVEIEPTWSMEDDAYPDLPSRLFPTLLAKATARCFVSFKQVSNVKEDQAERRGIVRHQNDLSKANGPKPIDRLPNYAKPGRATFSRSSKRPS